MKLRLLSLILLLGGCSTPFRFVVPALRFQSPEINGPKENTSFAFGLQSYNDVELTSSVETSLIHSSPSSFRQRFMEQDDNLVSAIFNFSYLYLNLGYNPAFVPLPIEFYWTLPSTLGAKLQLIGDNSDDAKSGNFSLALTAAYASRGVNGGSASSAETPEPGYYRYDFDRKIYDTSAILGYRLSDQVLLYSGVFLFNSPYNMTQNLSTGTGDQATISGTVNSYGGNFGIHIGKGDSGLKLEIAINKLEAYLNTETFVHGGLSFSTQF